MTKLFSDRERRALAEDIADLVREVGFYPLPTRLLEVLSHKHDGAWVAQPLLPTEESNQYLRFDFEWNAHRAELRITALVDGERVGQLIWK